MEISPFLSYVLIVTLIGATLMIANFITILYSEYKDYIKRFFKTYTARIKKQYRQYKHKQALYRI